MITDIELAEHAAGYRDGHQIGAEGRPAGPGELDGTAAYRAGAVDGWRDGYQAAVADD